MDVQNINDKKKLIIILSLALILGVLAMPVAASADVDMGWLGELFNMLLQAFGNLGNLISNAFSSIFSAIQSWLNPVIEWFGDKLHAIGQALGDMVNSITGTLQNMWNAIKQFFSTIFKPILDLVYGILYLIKQIFIVIKLIIQLIAHTFLLFVAIGAGFINTIMGLTNWSASSEYFSVYTEYAQSFEFVIGFAASSGVNLVAAIAAVGVWVLTAHAGVRLVTGGSR